MNVTSIIKIPTNLRFIIKLLYLVSAVLFCFQALKDVTDTIRSYIIE